ncbi:MAG: hypothetical protein EGP12_09550 [SAR202 cluster bacterium]|jgi:hypothetical protein|nr:MAG: hypothetical protein EGP12_09550 [SAR202 cluster bacterium]|tara:strand:- start:292 stop:921 length:630 start_codon:yes stop_codon:yes gene_type:complete
MQYFINFIRTPLPGKGPEVLAAVKASLDATGRPGNLTVPISVPNPTQNGAAFVSLIGGFQNLDEVDAMMDASFNDDNVQNRLAAIDALCHRSSYVLSENLSGPIERPDGYQPNLISRTFFNAKLGSRNDLLAALLEVREKAGSKVKPMVSRPIAGNAGLIRVTNMATTLQEMEDARKIALDELRSAGVLDLLSQSPWRSVGKIVHRIQS